MQCGCQAVLGAHVQQENILSLLNSKPSNGKTPSETGVREHGGAESGSAGIISPAKHRGAGGVGGKGQSFFL